MASWLIVVGVLLAIIGGIGVPIWGIIKTVILLTQDNRDIWAYALPAAMIFLGGACCLPGILIAAIGKWMES